MIMTAALLYILAMFNEAWLVNLGVFTCCTIFSIVRASADLAQADSKLDIHWVAIIVLF